MTKPWTSRKWLVEVWHRWYDGLNITRDNLLLRDVVSITIAIVCKREVKEQDFNWFEYSDERVMAYQNIPGAAHHEYGGTQWVELHLLPGTRFSTRWNSSV